MGTSGRLILVGRRFEPLRLKELKDFRRIHLEPGQTTTVQFVITPDKLSFLNEDMRRVVEPGLFDIMVGPSSSSHRLLTVKLEIVAR